MMESSEGSVSQTPRNGEQDFTVGNKDNMKEMEAISTVVPAITKR